MVIDNMVMISAEGAYRLGYDNSNIRWVLRKYGKSKEYLPWDLLTIPHWSTLVMSAVSDFYGENQNPRPLVVGASMDCY